MATRLRLARALVQRRQPAYVIAFVTGRCDLRCALCCPAATSSRADPEMTPSEWGAALADARALLHLTITGGEPFLRDDLDELILAAARASGVPRLSINTHGQATERIVVSVERLLGELQGVDLCLSVSVDGEEAVHGELRGKPGAFTAARETVRQLAPLRDHHRALEVRVSSLLQPGNATSLERLIDRVSGWPVDQHEIVLVRDVEPGIQRELVDSYLRLSARAATLGERSRAPIMTRLNRTLVRETADRALDRGTAPRCLAGGRMVEVFPDGTVRGCEMDKMRGEPALGSVASGRTPLAQVVRSEEARAFRRKARTCRCSFECATTCNIVFQPAEWSRLR